MAHIGANVDVSVRYWDSHTKIIKKRTKYCNVLTYHGIVNMLEWLSNVKDLGYIDKMGVGSTGSVVPESITNTGFGNSNTGSNFITESILERNKSVTISSGVGTAIYSATISPEEANNFTWNELVLFSADLTAIARVVVDNPYPKDSTAGATIQWTITLQETIK